MRKREQPSPRNPQDAFWQYIQELEREYATWYRRSSRRTQWAWGVGQAVALGAGFAASLLAAFAGSDLLARSGWVRAALVILPALGALTSSLLAQTRVRELLAVRERGREAIQALISRARADYASVVDDPSRATELHAALVHAVSALERQQAADFLLVAPGDPLPAEPTGGRVDRGAALGKRAPGPSYTPPDSPEAQRSDRGT